MLTISYFDAGSFLFIAFMVGVLYEHLASYYDYKTGKYIGRCVKWKHKAEVEED